MIDNYRDIKILLKVHQNAGSFDLILKNS